MKLKHLQTATYIVLSAVLTTVFLFTGCAQTYSDQWLYTDDVSTVYVEMFENRTFRRNLEYTLTDALVKRIEAETPYKVVSDRSRADSVISGEISAISETILAGERQTGRPLEKLAVAYCNVSWKNTRDNEFIIKNMEIKASTSYSGFQDQTIDYAKDATANKLAERVVELMQLQW